MNSKTFLSVSWKEWRDLILLVMFWGSAFALTKLAVQTVSPWWVVALRMLFAALIVSLFAMVYRIRLTLTARDCCWFFLFGLIGNVIPFYLIAVATQTISSSLAGIYIATVPLMVLPLAASLLPEEQLTWGKVAVFLLGFAGVVLLIGPQSFFQAHWNKEALMAQFLMIIAALGYASTLVLVRKAPRYHPLMLSSGMFWASVLLIFPVTLWLDPFGYQDFTWLNSLYVLGLGLLPTALAAIVLFSLIHRVGPSFISLSNYMVPGFAVLLGLIFLNETLALMDIAGLLVILFAVWMASRLY
jgi:drug/metabolite transporter (DMT)-like permease